MDKYNKFFDKIDAAFEKFLKSSVTVEDNDLENIENLRLVHLTGVAHTLFALVDLGIEINKSNPVLLLKEVNLRLLKICDGIEKLNENG